MLTNRQGLLMSATLLALAATQGTDAEVEAVVDTALVQNRLCDALETLNQRIPEEYARVAMEKVRKVLETLPVAKPAATEAH